MLGICKPMNTDTISTQEDYENECHELKKIAWNKYNNLPEVKERKKTYDQSPKAKQYDREYWQRKEVKERKNELNQEPKNNPSFKPNSAVRSNPPVVHKHIPERRPSTCAKSHSVHFEVPPRSPSFVMVRRNPPRMASVPQIVVNIRSGRCSVRHESSAS